LCEGLAPDQFGGIRNVVRGQAPPKKEEWRVKYFLGIRLSRELEERCEHYRRLFRAPRTVAHITVVPPFLWNKNPQALEAVLEKALENMKPFDVEGNGIGSFGKRVLFVNVSLSPELQALHKALSQGLKNEGIPVENRPYHPHITLATRVTPEAFARYNETLRDVHFQYSFPITHLSVFHFTPEGRWVEWRKVPLESNL